LRLLRAVRLATQLNFEIEPETFRAIQTHAAKIKLISAERIRDELVKLFAPPGAPHPQAAALGAPPSRWPAENEKLATSASEPERRLAVGLPPETQPAQSSSPSPPRSEGESRGELSPSVRGEHDSVTHSNVTDQQAQTLPNAGTTSPSPIGWERASSPARGLTLLRESALLEHVLPEVAATIHCGQSPDYHPEGSVFNHLVLMLQKMPLDADPLLPWAILMHDIAKPLTASRDEKTGSIHFYEHERIGAEMTERILDRLRFPRKQIDAVAIAVRCHMQFKDAPQMRKSTLRRLLMRPTFPLELQLHRVDCLGSHSRLDVYDFLIAQSQELAQQPEIHPPLLTGEDLIKMGLPPGPSMGALLNEIREKQLQDELKTPAEARAWAREQISRESKVQGRGEHGCD
jgi:tRNA nucleotidyltransferase/poly(A) polymerase